MERIKEIPAQGVTGNLIRILKGTAFAIMVTLVLLLIYSCLLSYTNINENTIPTVVIIVTAFSTLIGSFISSMNIKKNGLTNGTLVGLFYILTIYTLSSIMHRNFEITFLAIIMIVLSVLTGAIGGIFGVNRQ